VLAAALAASALYTPPARAHEYAVPPSPDTVVGEVKMVKATADDTLPDIARRYEVGYEAIRLANPGVDTWLPGKGTEVVVPSQYVLPDAPHEGIVVNVPEMRLYYFPKPRPGETPRVFTYPISVGRGDWQTPLVVTRVVRKEKNPAWRPPESIRAEHAARGDPLPKFVPAGPDNPLGDYALRLSVPGYLIHGTNKPYGIGMRVTHGCIRLYPEDINALFHMVPVGTPVRIVNQPVKVGWLDHRLYMEVHPAFVSDDAGKPINLTPIVQAVIAATGQPPSDKVVNWDAVYSAARLTTGIPTEVSRGVVASAGAVSMLRRTD
jgi:L,D-transpeptidase ErfK/SrfK